MTSIKDERQQQQSPIPMNATSPGRSSHGAMTNEEYQLLQNCTRALNYLMSFEVSGPFIMPVPKNYQTYYKKIEQPMDLTTLERNLHSRKYTTYQEFEVHLSLVWRNAMEYHQRHTLIYKKAAMLQQLYHVLKQGVDQSLESVSFKSVEFLPPSSQEPHSRSDQSDFYMVAAVSPEESPLMVQHYENFAYARPIYDELHGPLFHQLLGGTPDYPHETEPYPRLYVSRNRSYLIKALEKQPSSTLAILWNTHFDAPPPHPDKSLHRSNLLIMTTHVTHGIPYKASHNAVRSPSSYSVSTPAGVSTTSDSDYSPQAWIKFQPTHTFYNVKMVISKRLENAFFSRAYDIQPVSLKIQPHLVHSPKQPSIHNSFDILLIERMKQCLKSGKSDISVLDQHGTSATLEWNINSGQLEGSGDLDIAGQQNVNDGLPIVISDDDDIDENDTAPTATISTSNTNSLEPTNDSGGNLEHDTTPATTIATTNTESPILGVMDEMRDYARSKGVKMVNVNDYMDNTTLQPGVEGHFKLVRYVNDDKTLVVLIFRGMTTTQRVNEIVSLLKLKGQEGMADIVAILYANDDENKVVGFTMERYQYTLKQYIQAHTHTHQHLTPCQKMDLIRQMLKCLHCIHENGIGHRDLSETSFMVDSVAEENTPRLTDGSKGARVRLIDFGKAVFTTSEDVRRWWVGPSPSDDGDKAAADRVFTEDELVPKTQAELDEWCGHLPLISTFPDHNHRCYRSIQTLPRTQKDWAKLPWYINPAAEDMYSMAVLIWRVFTDKEPWNGVLERNLADLHVMVKDDAAIELQVGRGVSGNLSQLFLLKCIRSHPNNRLSAKELLTRLDTPHIAEGLLDEWAAYYSSTSARSRRTAAATQFQNEQARSSLPKVLQKRKEQQVIQQRNAFEMETERTRSQKRHGDVEHGKIQQKNSTKQAQQSQNIIEPSLSVVTTSSELLPTPPNTETAVSKSSLAQSNTVTTLESSPIQSNMETRHKSKLTSSSTQNPPSTPSIKTRAQVRRVAAGRSTSPHSSSTLALKSPSSFKHAASLPSSPKRTVHTPSTPSFPSRCLPSSPPSQPASPDDHQQQHPDSSFFTTNITENPYLHLIPYPPSNVRARKRIQLTSQPASSLTQQYLNWTYDSNFNLKLPSLGLTMGGSSSASSIFDESDSELTSAPTTDISRSPSPSPIFSASGSSLKVEGWKTHDDSMIDNGGNVSIGRREPCKQPTITGSKRKSPSSPSVNDTGVDSNKDDASKTIDHGRQKKIRVTVDGTCERISKAKLGLNDNNDDAFHQDTFPSTPSKSQAPIVNSSDELNSSSASEVDDDDDEDGSNDDDDDDDDNYNDDDDDDDTYEGRSNTSPTTAELMINSLKKKGRPLGSKSRRGNKPLGRPPGRVFKPLNGQNTATPSEKSNNPAKKFKKRKTIGKY